MKLQKVIQRLQKLHKKKIDLSLDRTFKLLKKLGNPQDKLEKVISVVGTNSKYSMIKIFQSSYWKLLAQIELMIITIIILLV